MRLHEGEGVGVCLLHTVLPVQGHGIAEILLSKQMWFALCRFRAALYWLDPDTQVSVELRKWRGWAGSTVSHVMWEGGSDWLWGCSRNSLRKARASFQCKDWMHFSDMWHGEKLLIEHKNHHIMLYNSNSSLCFVQCWWEKGPSVHFKSKWEKCGYQWLLSFPSGYCHQRQCCLSGWYFIVPYLFMLYQFIIVMPVYSIWQY